MTNNKRPTIVVDADAIVSQAHPNDSNHDVSAKITKKLIEKEARFIYPITAITEAVTVLQHKLDSTATAYGTATSFTNPDIEVAEIDQTLYANAVKNYLKPEGSKKDTVFDCIVLEVANKYNADAIFSFDNFYKKHGFKLAKDLIKQ